MDLEFCQVKKEEWAQPAPGDMSGTVCGSVIGPRKPSSVEDRKRCTTEFAGAVLNVSNGHIRAISRNQPIKNNSTRSVVQVAIPVPKNLVQKLVGTLLRGNGLRLADKHLSRDMQSLAQPTDHVEG